MEKENNLKRLMENKSGSVKAFSEDIGLAYTTVRSILERGVYNAKVENVIKICKGLNIKPEDILDYEQPQQDTLAAHLDGDFTEEELQEILEYAEFVKQKHRNK
ncbi:XRE family transcriptional regulator [Staphylococcus chromogenes]|nr:helix-turn-helix transcriptional regulator [Staphylococcus chromogenes]MCE4965270.1 helix-turn-helix transcriptional regulator [Staphylococcus chromogenes]PTF76740.1 XRE family transcriptional regulator [Staphylococcus chromogenes]